MHCYSTIGPALIASRVVRGYSDLHTSTNSGEREGPPGSASVAGHQFAAKKNAANHAPLLENVIAVPNSTTSTGACILACADMPRGVVADGTA